MASRNDLDSICQRSTWRERNGGSRDDLKQAREALAWLPSPEPTRPKDTIDAVAFDMVEEIALRKDNKPDDSFRDASGDSYLELMFLKQIRSAGLPEPVRELNFHPKRKWRFDFAWPDYLIAVEIEGGTFSKASKSRHTTGVGHHNDLDKYNEARRLGWTVYQFTSQHVNSGDGARYMQNIFGDEAI